jgi:hypothetical protein
MCYADSLFQFVVPAFKMVIGSWFFSLVVVPGWLRKSSFYPGLREQAAKYEKIEQYSNDGHKHKRAKK